jgi:hydrogenase maturation protein HypF
LAVLSQLAAERWRIAVSGIVQGVGFRPFVYAEAQRLGLSGFVHNDEAGVTIEAEGDPAQLAQLLEALRAKAPPLARVDSVVYAAAALQHSAAFVIEQSASVGERHALVAPDVSSCDDCLRELFDPGDRRFRYPFINCTNCGPRFTIVADLPYDRPLTTMRGFQMCAACQAEYDDPHARRFHAQPNACPVCGPQLRWQQGEASGDGALRAAVDALCADQIVAVKGVGGYHLACAVRSATAVAALRRRKRRAARPFALMVADLATARQLCHVSDAEAALLASPRRPIVLLAQRKEAAIAAEVAPGVASLGLMLPYAPLHYVLLHDFAARRRSEPAVLLFTSGNLSDEPIAFADDEAHTRLAPLADAVLSHSRPIQTRCDDSVAQVGAGGPVLLRRSRGYAPEPIALSFDCPAPLLAVGGHQKNTFCLASGRRAFVSHHVGDLENLETLLAFRSGIAHFQRLFELTPQAVAYDLHPDYLATQEALASQLQPKIGVQHHHAHIASVLAEHGLDGPVIGVAADGSGYGLDGAVWGGEIFIADRRAATRFAHIAYLPLPGVAQAVREPWRMAAVALQRAFGEQFLDLDIPFTRRLDRKRWHLLAQMIARGLNAPPSSSLGRLFDAVAALIGLRDVALYEGQAAAELEAIASDDALVYPLEITPGQPAIIETAPLVRAVVADLQAAVPPALIAGRFHGSIAIALTRVCTLARATSGLNVVALSGGVFQNRRLLELLWSQLQADGFQVYTNRQVPPNDGGLSLGQVAVAAARLSA